MNAGLIVLVFLVLFAIVLVAISVGYRLLETQRKKQVQGILQAVSGTGENTETTILVEPSEDDPLDTVLKNFGAANIQSMIQQAGLQWTVSRFLMSTALGAVAGMIIGGAFRPLGLLLPSMAIPAVILGSIPFLHLRHKRSKRLSLIESQLPEALDFLARSMRAGHAFSISLEMLGQESPEPLGQEFRVLFNEHNLGAPIEIALTNLARRVPLLDIRLMVSSVALQKQTGGNLSEILLRLAYVIRERFRLRGQVKAASAHGRMTAGVLTVLPIVLIGALMVIAPGYLQGMANDPDGKWLILGAIVCQIIGYFVMRNITNIKV